MKRIIHLTISDCKSERRIFNQAFSALDWGYHVHIIALKTPDTPAIEKLKGIHIRRLRCRFWRGGPLKFIIFNWKAFGYLLRQRTNIIHAHDLWVLPAAVFAARIKRIPVVYDAHEYYRGLLVFQKKSLAGLLWKWVEKRLIGHVQALITINSHHAQLYQRAYPGVKVKVIKNVPRRSEIPAPLPRSQRKSVIIYQGLFRPGRGLEYIIPAMAKLPEGELWLVGHGELEDVLRRQVHQYQIVQRVKFWGFQPYSQMLAITTQAMAGIALFTGDHLNYQFASPNKFFEYIQAGTPVIATDIPTFRQFISRYSVGYLIPESRISTELPQIMQRLLTDSHLWESYHQQCLQAAKEWNWETEAPHLQSLYKEIENKRGSK